ncbi:unnamed protein product [Heterobilharzia americana]|nr:unnamed protein product [Heterobilharzia americana]
MVCCNTTTTRIDKFGELRGMLGDADDAILTSGRGDEGRVLVFGREVLVLLQFDSNYKRRNKRTDKSNYSAS